MIRLSCPNGGHDLTLEPEHVTVVAIAGNLWARYRCPHCGTIGMKTVQDRIAERLARAGCPVERIDAPDTSQPVDNGPISLDEVAALTYQLLTLTAADLDELA